MFERDDVWVIEQPHGLKLTVLVPPVLQNFLYRNGFSCLKAFRLEDNAERTLSNNTFGHVADRLHLTFEGKSKPKQKKLMNQLNLRKKKNKKVNLFRLAVSTTDGSDYNVASLCAITINHSGFHLLSKNQNLHFSCL